jgi:hypothetical protein
MEVMVNTVVLSTDRAGTRFEINPGPQRIKNSPFKGKRVKGIEPSCPYRWWIGSIFPSRLDITKLGWTVVHVLTMF